MGAATIDASTKVASVVNLLGAELRLGPVQNILGYRAVLAKITPSTSYSTGGDTIAIDKLSMRKVFGALILSTTTEASASGGKSVEIVLGVSPKIKIYTTAATEPAAASDQSAAARYVLFLGN